LAGSDAWARHNAIIALGLIGDEAAVPGLTSLLHEGVPEAANALASIARPSSIKSLIAALEAPRSDVCQLAAGALGRAGDARAVPSLVDAARKRKDEFDAMAGAMGAIRDRASVPFLVSNLRRKSAMYALVNIGSRAVPALIEKLDSLDVDTQRNAA